MKGEREKKRKKQRKREKERERNKRQFFFFPFLFFFSVFFFFFFFQFFFGTQNRDDNRDHLFWVSWWVGIRVKSGSFCLGLYYFLYGILGFLDFWGIDW